MEAALERWLFQVRGRGVTDRRRWTRAGRPCYGKEKRANLLVTHSVSTDEARAMSAQASPRCWRELFDNLKDSKLEMTSFAFGDASFVRPFASFDVLLRPFDPRF